MKKLTFALVVFAVLVVVAASCQEEPLLTDPKPNDGIDNQLGG